MRHKRPAFTTLEATPPARFRYGPVALYRNPIRLPLTPPSVQSWRERLRLYGACSAVPFRR